MQHDAMEELRLKYKPSTIRVLFIGESPPRSGHFFYTDETILHKATREAFARSYGIAFTSVADFIDFFSKKCCYLDDLCLKQVNGLKRSQRRLERRRGVPALTERILQYQPGVVVCVMKGITPYVLRAISRTSMKAIQFHSLPFPNWVYKRPYVSELRQLIECYRKKGILPD